LASQIDVAPTILDAAGIIDDHRDAVDAMAGHSLLGDDEHETVFAEHTPSNEHDPSLTRKYGIDFSPYDRAYKIARTTDYTVEFRSDGTTIAHNRRDPSASVPDDEIERLRALVNDRFEWEDTSSELNDAVREQLERVGYLG
jgi:arylsulfatase A-like enzyme